MTLEQLVRYKAVAAVLMATVGWPIISAVLNILLRKKTPEQWEAWAEKKPGMALAVELMRALGADPSKALTAAQRYARRKAGVLPAAPPPELPPSVAGLLADPVKRAVLESLAKRLTEVAAQPEPPQPAQRDTLVPPFEAPSESRSPDEGPESPAK